MISVQPPSKNQWNIYFFMDVSLVKQEVQVLILTLLKNIDKCFLLLRSSSKTSSYRKCVYVILIKRSIK